MKSRIFLYTNIAIDYLANRIPFGKDAMTIFSLSPHRNQLCISSLSFTTIFYVLRKHFEQNQLIDMLDSLQSLVEVLPVNDKIIDEALHSNFNDFEDAVQYFSAQLGQVDYIITRNPKDFKNTSIPVYTPTEFLAIPFWLEDTNTPVLNEPEVEYKKQK